ncbi:MAG: hypothetical protein EOM83_06060 [Clostridia bacterium]|nr:hypothetical protein [Clostridia bacterium]
MTHIKSMTRIMLTNMKRMRILLAIFMILSSSVVFGQTNNDNYVFWSPSKKLTVDDFGIKTKNSETVASFAQFSIDYQIRGFDFMTKNFNKKVRNYLIKSAPIIDTTTDVSISLRYQQTLFDISEIYTRQFRKALRENRKKLASGFQIAEDLNQKAITDFSNRRVIYDRDTNFGTIQDKQLEWDLQIQNELEELKEYAFE